MVEKQKLEADQPTLQELSKEIHNAELKLNQLREEYLSRTGVLPSRTFRDIDWRWTIFMTLGIAYITFIVYYLAIKEAGRGEGFGIPDFLYNVEIQYYGVLTFFIIFGIVNIQTHRLRGYQVLVLFLGFWCAHWLLYDWSWWAMEIGFGHVDLDIFWVREFYAPLLIEKPPMWLFLIEAILGAVMSVYTFLVPNNYKKLIPTIIWLYAVYINALVCSMIGLNTPITLSIGLVLIAVAFGLMFYYSLQKLKENKRKKAQTLNSIPAKVAASPLTKPYIYITIFLVAISYVFLVTIPLVGFLLGMVTWYVMPFVYFIVNAIPFQKLSQKKKIVIITSAIGGIVAIMLFLTMIMPMIR
jgi:positive regulator of sigma E activity